MLTFADDPVEDGPQLLDADLQVLGKKGGWHPPLGKAAPHCPRGPLCHAPTYLPCQLPEEGLEVLIDLLFREHLLDGEEGAVRGASVRPLHGQQPEAAPGPLISSVSLRL